MLRYLYLLVLSIIRPSYSQPQIQLNNTLISGRSIQILGSIEQEFFGGIPYADAGRFQPPVPHILSVPTLDATAYGPSCPQTGGSVSEACLTLDVFRPAPIPNTYAASSSLPVMVWIYGGSFLNGNSAGYNASGLLVESVARGTPIIFVSINYRTGPFGFPQGQDAAQRGILNLGIKDMLAALTWVQSNIAAFGGDRSRVTVFGQSAGSVSIALMFLNSGLEKLVHGAILESGLHSTIPMYNASVRELSWGALIEGTPECIGVPYRDSFDCLQNATLDNLVIALGRVLGTGPQEFPFPPVIDGELVPDLPSTLLARGQFARVPFIAGTVQDEGTSFISTNLEASSDSDLVDLLAVRDIPYQPSPSSAFTQAAGSIVSLYPNDPSAGSPFGTGDNTFGFNSEYKRMAAIAGDFEYQALRRMWSMSASSAGVKNYAYLFAVPDARSTGSPWLGINHASEIAFAHGGIILDTSTPPTAKLASVIIMNYWLSFAVSLDPNDGQGNVGRRQWMQYDHTNASVLQMGSDFGMIPDNYRDSQISSIINSSGVFAH